MKKRVFVATLCMLMSFAMVGCGESDLLDKIAKKEATEEKDDNKADASNSASNEASTEEVEKENDVPSEGATVMDATIKPEDFAIEDCTGKKFIYFNDTKVPIQYTVSEDGGAQLMTSDAVCRVYQIEDGENQYGVEACYYDGVTVDQVVKSLEEHSVDTPMIDIHSEGTYVTMATSVDLICGFVAEAKTSGVYAVLVHGTAQDMIPVSNSLVESLVGSGLVMGSNRTEYGQPVGGDETGSTDTTPTLQVVGEGVYPIDISALGKPDYEGEFFTSWYKTTGGRWKDVELTVSRGSTFDSEESYRQSGTYIGNLSFGGLNWECYNYASDGNPMYVFMFHEVQGVYNYIKIVTWDTANDVGDIERYLSDVF